MSHAKLSPMPSPRGKKTPEPEHRLDGRGKHRAISL